MRNHLIAGVAALLITTASGVAMAQTQPQPGAPAAAPADNLPAFPQPEWAKVCGQSPTGKELCQTVRDLLAPNTSLIMTAQVNQDKGGKPNLTITIPAGMVLPLGARVMVDGQTLDTAKYRICLGPTCVADMPLTEASLATLKKGKKLTVQAITFQGQPISFDMGLEGFGKTFDGAGLDKDGFRARQQAYGQKLQAIFQPYIDAQQKAQQQQQPATPPAANAPAAPAAPAQ